jgi:hypothetical protein
MNPCHLGRFSKPAADRTGNGINVALMDAGLLFNRFGLCSKPWFGNFFVNRREKI